jgi:hypothetical protein
MHSHLACLLIVWLIVYMVDGSLYGSLVVVNSIRHRKADTVNCNGFTLVRTPCLRCFGKELPEVDRH